VKTTDKYIDDFSIDAIFVLGVPLLVDQHRRCVDVAGHIMQRRCDQLRLIFISKLRRLIHGKIRANFQFIWSLVSWKKRYDNQFFTLLCTKSRFYRDDKWIQSRCPFTGK